MTASAGRKPRPPQLKVLTGRSPGRDTGGRKIPDPPRFVRVPPEPPTWLSREAKAEWRRVVPELGRLKMLKQSSRSSLVAYCETWATFVQATREVHRDGLTIEAKQGMLAHPAVAIARTAQKELRAWCAEFGLTPSAEGRLSLPDETADGDDLLD